MKLSKTFQRAAVGTMLGAAAISVSSEALAAFQAFVSVKGRKSGQFASESTQKGRSDKWIPVVSFSFGIKSPRDVATGQASGKRQYDQFCFSKEVGHASPQFFASVATNEVLDEVAFEFVKPNANGQESVYQTIKLTNATIASVKQYSARPDQGNTPTHAALTVDVIPLDEVCFTFQKIDVLNKDTNKTFSDNWQTTQ